MIKDLVSVIIPAYQAQAYIGRCVESVLAQSYRNFEVIVVNDGSTDRTEEIVRSISDSRVQYIYQKNGSQAVARNTGMKRAEGEFIAFLDADDWWFPEKLARQLPLFEDEELALVYCGLAVADAEGEITGHLQLPKWRGEALVECLRQNIVVGGGSTAVLRRSVLTMHKIEFQTRRQGVEDWDFWLRVMEVGKIDFTPEALAVYRDTPGSSSKQVIRMRDGKVRTLNEAMERIALRRDLPAQKRRNLMRAAENGIWFAELRYGHDMRGLGDRQAARAAMARAMRLRPGSPRSWWGLLKSWVG